MRPAQMRFRLAGLAGLGLFALCALAKDSPPTFRVTRVELKQDGRLDDRILQQCDVGRVLTESVQRFQAKHRKKGSVTTDLVLRVDRIARVQGTFVADFGGTDLAVTLLGAGGRETNQAFFCRANGLKSIRNPSHCDRVNYCGEKIAEQISTWLSWQTAN
jgi:hypothetical protein